MSNEVAVIDNSEIQRKIFTIRGLQVMLDRDLAELYQVETKVLNQAVKRNAGRFPDDFIFQLSQEEFNHWKSHFVTSNGDKMGLRRPPYAFTEAGVSMLSSVLKSDVAVVMSVNIIRAFVQMRKFINNNVAIFQRLDNVEQKQLITDTKLDKVFAALEAGDIKPKQGIFFDGQVFDAYVFIADLIKSAKTSIVLIDNYVDETVLTLLSKRAVNCSATIYTKTITKKLKLDLKKHNGQYPLITIKTFNDAHDRFLLLDDSEIYHIGASLKDLGKKWFAFSKFDKGALDILERLGDKRNT